MTGKRRRGRPRKTGPRQRNGRLKTPRRAVADSPRAIAAAMPHRRGLGEHALDQRAGTELGRMGIRGELEAVHVLAGEAYAVIRRGYIATLDGPRWPWRGAGRVLACNGCPDPENMRFCLCDLRRRVYEEAVRVLHTVPGAQGVLDRVIDDEPCHRLSALREGLQALALHFGLTRKEKMATKTIIPKHVEPPVSGSVGGRS